VVERATVDLQARVIIVPEEGAPGGAVRRVQLLVPPAPRVAIAIDVPMPTQAGPGRSYKYVQVPPDARIPIWLQPHQLLVAMVVAGTGGMAELGYICEFFDEEPVP
jgi:hypothetical protein